MLTPEREKKIDELLTRYPSSRSALLPALWVAQEQYGWISLELQRYLAIRLGITPEQVREVVTFYSMYNDRPVGKYHLQVCCTTPCMLMGSDDVIGYLEKKLDIGRGQTTGDGLFTVSQVECLGSCGTAPMLQVNREKYDENLTTEKVDALLDRLRTQAAAEGSNG
ncbi:MAG: NAD(P)H-dependent oxidoreductase subunit E [Blastocatellia bacterium]|jgi:NADH-quinone oxidoreductase subunit E|nr:NAD(P)H-dependent oxidoreductase subunit E [Blastocatellia bacterium]MBK6428584.1 NAD(P)H-dependent oxidoreductase subunit E [Blastocatellia bacterium]